MNKNDKTLYEYLPVVSELNHVEGFNPLQFIKKIKSPLDGKPIYDMDLKHKQLWLRLKYPQSKVQLVPLRLTDKMAVFDARIYFDIKDSDLAANYVWTTTKEIDGLKYAEKAQYIAATIACSMAGFGCQFIIPESQTVNIYKLNDVVKKEEQDGENNNDIENITSTIQTEEKADSSDLNIEEIKSDNRAEELHQKVDTSEQLNVEYKSSEKSILNMTETEKTQAEEITVSRFTSNMTVEEILKDMTLEEAYAVVVDFGICNGKTLEEVANERAISLKFYCSGYAGDNNLVIAGSRLILDSLSEKEKAA